jgi:drug/metabolite transporter (DMT)-like permease
MTQNLRLAVMLALAGEGVLTLMDAIIKTLTPRYPTFEIAFLRFACGSIFASLYFAWMRPGWPSAETLRFNGMRAIFIVITATSFFFALSKLPIAECMALSFLSPLFMALFGGVFLREQIDGRIAFALLAGVIGMVVIVGGQIGTRDYAADAWLGAVAVVISAIFYALVVVLLRARANRDPMPTIILIQNIAPAVLLAGPAWFVWTTPTLRDALTFLGIGVFGVVGHLFIANAFARAEAARLAPVHYSVLVWGTLYGFLLFGDYPGVATVVGAVFIVAATWITQRKRIG